MFSLRYGDVAEVDQVGVGGMCHEGAVNITEGSCVQQLYLPSSSLLGRRPKHCQLLGRLEENNRQRQHCMPTSSLLNTTWNVGPKLNVSNLFFKPL